MQRNKAVNSPYRVLYKEIMYDKKKLTELKIFCLFPSDGKNYFENSLNLILWNSNIIIDNSMQYLFLMLSPYMYRFDNYDFKTLFNALMKNLVQPEAVKRFTSMKNFTKTSWIFEKIWL